MKHIRKIRGKKVTALVLAAVLSLGLIGCTGAKNGDADTKSEVVELSLLDYFIPGEGATRAFTPLYEKFLEENPDIQIDEESISNADTATKVQTLAAADELPDIFMLKGQMAKTFVENGKVLALDDILASDTEWSGNFREGVFSNFTIDEKVYGIPFQVTNTCVYYNTDLFKKAGIEGFPETWDELLEAVTKLKAIDVVPIALGNKEKWNAESVILSTLGNRFTGDAWYQSIRTGGGASFLDAEFVNALEAMDALAKAGAFNGDVNSIDGAQQRQMYMNGKAAITIDGTWAVSDLDENCPEDVKEATQIAALPSVTDGAGDSTAITGGAGWAYAVNANISEEKLQAVKKFLIAVTGPDYGANALKEGGLPAMNPAEYEVDETKIISARFTDFSKDRPFIPVYDHQLDSNVIDVMNSGLQELLIGNVSPEELAMRIQTEYERGEM